MFGKDCWDLIMSKADRDTNIKLTDIYPFPKTIEEFGIEAIPPLEVENTVRWFNENVLLHPPRVAYDRDKEFMTLYNDFNCGMVCKKIFAISKFSPTQGVLVFRSSELLYFTARYYKTPDGFYQINCAFTEDKMKAYEKFYACFPN